MKCNSSKVYNQKYRLAQERAKAEREAKLNAMTPEEREAFLQAERKKSEESARKGKEYLTNLAAIKSAIGDTYG